MILISNFERDVTLSGVRLRCSATIDGKNEQIYFDIDGPKEKLNQIEPDPSSFLIGMLIAAMERGEDMHIEGNVPETFLHHVNVFLVPFLIACWPSSRSAIKVTASSQAEWPIKPKATGAMTGLSCGVDSIYTLMEYTHNDVPEPYRLKSVAVFDVGAFGEKYDAISAARYTQAEDRARAIASQIGCDFYTVKSNIQLWQKDVFRRIVSLLNCACALALADVCDTYLASSSESYFIINVPDQRSRKRRSIDNVDPILLPLISSRRLEIISSGAGTDRFRKILALIDRSPYLDQLTTCTRIDPFKDGGKNCGSCAKCGQFLLIAEANKVLDKFAGNFDLASYHRRKWRVCQRLITRAWKDDEPTISRDTVAFVRDNGIKFPITALGASFILSRLHRLAPHIF